MVSKQTTRAVLLTLNAIVFALLAIEAISQEILPSLRRDEAIRGEAVCPNRPSSELQLLTAQDPPGRSPWFRVLSFSIPRTSLGVTCDLVVRVPGLLHINRSNHYVKQRSLDQPVDIANDNIGSGMLLFSHGAYSYVDGTLQIPASALDSKLAGSRLELLVSTSLTERVSFFLDALKVFVREKTVLLISFVFVMLVLGIAVGVSRRQARPA